MGETFGFFADGSKVTELLPSGSAGPGFELGFINNPSLHRRRNWWPDFVGISGRLQSESAR